MATPTYTAIASITLGSSASSVTFSSIPQDYRDLVIVINGDLSFAEDINMYLNSDAGANYSFVRMAGSGSSAFSSSGSSQVITTIYTTQSTHIIQIMDYSATDKHKTALSRGSNPANTVFAYAYRWANTNAVTSVELEAKGSSVFTSGTTLALYGIEA